MTGKPDKPRAVPSDLAHPSRPGDEFGPHQPLEPTSAVPPPEELPPDDRLLWLVHTALAQDGSVDTGDIRVTVLENVVSLDGSVALEFQRSLATALVNAVPGVLVVKNRLVVPQR